MPFFEILHVNTADISETVKKVQSDASDKII